MQNSDVWVNEVLNELDSDCYDLIELGKAMNSRCAVWHFATPILNMVYKTIPYGSETRKIPIIRDCITPLIYNLSWWDSVLGVPIRKIYYHRSTPYDGQEECILANSIIATFAKYRLDLNDIGGSGIGSILFSELLRGTEWGCLIATREGLDNSTFLKKIII